MVVSYRYRGININMKTCIIILCNNNKDTIIRAIDSITKIDEYADHILVCDNESKDNTYEFLAEKFNIPKISTEEGSGLNPNFTTMYNNLRITFIRKKYSNISNSLNILINMVLKDYDIIGFLDPKCWYEKNKIKLCKDIFDNKEVMCVINDFFTHKNDGRKSTINRKSIDNKSLYQNYIPDINFFVRKEAFFVLRNGFNEIFKKYIDYDMMIRLSKIGLIYHIQEPLHNINYDDYSLEKDYLELIKRHHGR